MSGFNVQGLTKRFGSNTVVDDLDLAIEEGEFVVLLGPSGCGKTTTLRCLAGLERPEAGTITFGDRTVFDGSGRVDVPTHKRNIGMVFQSYALWPHLSVRKNIGYPLKVRGMKEQLRGGAVERAGSRWSTRRSSWTATRPSSAAASSSASPSPAAWWPSRTWCCSTNRSATWTHACATRCARRSTSCTTSWGSAPCSSPTTSPRRSRSGIGWRS